MRLKFEPSNIEDAIGYTYRRVNGIHYCLVATEIAPGLVTYEVWRHLDDTNVELEEPVLDLIYHSWQVRPELAGYIPDQHRDTRVSETFKNAFIKYASERVKR